MSILLIANEMSANIEVQLSTAPPQYPNFPVEKKLSFDTALYQYDSDDSSSPVTTESYGSPEMNLSDESDTQSDDYDKTVDVTEPVKVHVTKSDLKMQVFDYLDQAFKKLAVDVSFQSKESVDEYCEKMSDYVAHDFYKKFIGNDSSLKNGDDFSLTKDDDLDEPLLQDEGNRFTLFPIKYPEIYTAYKEAVSCFWIPDEVDLTQDIAEWNELNEADKHYIKYTIAFFAGSDGIVNENIVKNFMDAVKVAEARAFYGMQIAIENIHNEMYSLIIDTYITNIEEKLNLFNAIETIPSIKKKADWALKWINEERPFAERIVAFAIVEGIFFSSSFCAIFWIKKRGLLKGLTFSNELISKDEGQHVKFACQIHNSLKKRVPQKRIHIMLSEAVKIEHEYVNEAIPKNLNGMNAKLMCQYVNFVSDQLLVDLNTDKLYYDSNPFKFMNMISISGKSNFFERRVGEYSKANVMVKTEDRIVRFDAKY